MKLNSTMINGFGIKGMAGYGPSAWHIGSDPITISSRGYRNGKTPARSQREARTVNTQLPTEVPVLVARRYAGTEPRVWMALDLAVGLLLIGCPLMMGF